MAASTFLPQEYRKSFFSGFYRNRKVSKSDFRSLRQKKISAARCSYSESAFDGLEAFLPKNYSWWRKNLVGTELDDFVTGRMVGQVGQWLIRIEKLIDNVSKNFV